MPTTMRYGQTMHYLEQGQGLPVVLLHGFPLDSRVWEPLLLRLKGNHRFIAPDLRGFGQSTGGGAFTMESAADEVHGLLEQLGALPCVLGGLSMGGYIALEFAQRCPKDLKGLMFIDTKAQADTADARQARDEMIDLVRREGAKAVADRMLPKMLGDDTIRRRPQVLRDLQAIMESCPAETIAHALAGMRDREDHTANLASIPVPALVMVGESDALIPIATAEAMRREIPHATLAVIESAGHMAPMEQPDQVASVIESFLRSIP